MEHKVSYIPNLNPIPNPNPKPEVFKLWVAMALSLGRGPFCDPKK